MINPFRSWFPLSRGILNLSNFRNKSSLNRNWVLFAVHQKRSLNAPEKENMNLMLTTGCRQPSQACRQVNQSVDSRCCLSTTKLHVLLYILLSTGPIDSPSAAVDRPVGCKLFSSRFTSFSSFLFSPIQLDLFLSSSLTWKQSKFPTSMT